MGSHWVLFFDCTLTLFLVGLKMGGYGRNV